MITTVPACTASIISNNCLVLCAWVNLICYLLCFGLEKYICIAKCIAILYMGMLTVFLCILHDKENPPYSSILYIKYLHKNVIMKGRRILLTNTHTSVSLLCLSTILQKYKYMSDLQSCRYV